MTTRTKPYETPRERVAVARIPTFAPLSDMQFLVALMLGANYTQVEIASILGIARETVKHHIRQAANKIPGDLASTERVRMWARGATKDVLYADRVIVELAATQAATLARRPHRRVSYRGEATAGWPHQ